MLLVALIALAPSPLQKIEANQQPIKKTAVIEPVSGDSVSPDAIEPAKAVETPAAPAPAPQPAPTCASEIAKYDWPQNIATAIATAESSLVPSAHGDKSLTYYQNGVQYGDSWGCFQVRYLPGRPTPSELVNPATNVAHAYKLYLASGWSPWSVYNSGKYLRFL